jgi:type II secretory pathway predicted ATPase ExeA
MYENHFGLRQRPFRSLPDSEAYYPATGHEHALTRLARAVAEDEGLMLVSGAPGTGKTLLCHQLIDRLGEEVTTAFLSQGHVGGCVGLLQAILFDLSLPFAGRAEQELRLALTEFLLQQFAAGRRTVLVVDEAHLLPTDVLEEIRLLTNLEARQGKALQVVLSAQPGLREALRRPELASFHQRLAVRVQLEPLGLEEAADYLLHQVRAAGGRPEAVLADEAVEILARGSQGLPRLLNQAAHQALTLAYQAGAETVDAEAALEALAVLGLGAVAEAPAFRVPAHGADPETDLEVDSDAGQDAAERLRWPEEETLAGRPVPEEGSEPTDAGARLFSLPNRPA